MVAATPARIEQDDTVRHLFGALAATGFDPPGMADLRAIHQRYAMGSRDRLVAAEPAVKALLTYMDKGLNGMAVTAAAAILQRMGRPTNRLQEVRTTIQEAKRAMSQPSFASKVYNRMPLIAARYAPGRSLNIVFDPDFLALIREAGA
jgi:hypothetical protein